MSKEYTIEKIFQPIHYFVMFGKRGTTAMPVVPPSEFSYPLLRQLGRLPKSLAQFELGIDFYIHTLEAHSQLGYDVNFVYADSYDMLNSIIKNPQDLYIFLICTEEEGLEIKLQSLMDCYSSDEVLWVMEKTSPYQSKLHGNIVNSTNDIIAWLIEMSYRYSVPNMQIRVPYVDEKFQAKKYSFSATYPNRWMINNIEGNWGYDEEIDNEIKIKEHQNAIENPFAYNRQENLNEQLLTIQRLERFAASVSGKIYDFEDCFNPPLVLVAPYNSREVRKSISMKDIPFILKPKANILTKIFDYEYTTNYIIKQQMAVDGKNEVAQYYELLQNFITIRYLFTDFVAMLHCSVRFSPHLRLPTVGSSISRELSFVGIKNVAKLKTAKTVNEVIKKIGKKIVNAAISNQLANSIADRTSQIVAISDLPIEWLWINDIPLAFTHDICRLPEQPLVSELAQYVESRYACGYIIPQDIIKKTLVIFGCDDESFRQAQVPVYELQKKLGFEIKKCLSVNDFKNALEEVKPDLLIIDTHGNIDSSTRQTYLKFGDEKLFGQYVAENHIHAKLVFLSACSTCPTFDLVSSIANAFFEAGALSVTTSYLPLPVKDSTVLYLRLLNMLYSAATNGIHCNWLSFVSHIMRTSYIQEPMWYGDYSALTKHDQKYLAQTATELMLFKNRKDVYRKIFTGDFAKKMGANYNNILPNYLLYSTLGRADLIRFESYLQEKFSSLL